MRKDMFVRVSRMSVFAAVMFTSASLFAGQLYGPPIKDPALVGPVNDGGSGEGKFQILVPSNGTWTFNTNGSAAAWSLTTNWSGGTIADGGGTADFSTLNITGARNPNIDTTSRTVGILNIGDTNGTHSYTISASGGASLILDNTANSANAQLNQTATSNGDTISAPIVLNSTLDVSNASATQILTLSGVISGVGGLNLGSGTLALGTSANTFGGNTAINGGKITIGTSGTPLGAGSTLTLNGGTLTSTGNRAVGSALATSVSVTAASAITTTSTAGTVLLPFTGNLSGNSQLTIRNDAGVTTGQFDVRFGGGDATMSGAVVLDNGAGGGSVRFSDFNTTGTTHTFSGVISGNGGFNRSASTAGTGGLTVFTAANTYTGLTLVHDGTLQLGNGGATGSLSASSAIQIDNVGTLRFDRTTGADFVQGTDFSSSAITGAGKIIKDGTNSLTFNVANTFSGGLTINKGTVIATANGALGNGNISLTSGNAVVLTLQGGTNPNYVADSATLSIALDSTVNVSYSGTEVVGGFVVNGVSQSPGVYGSADFSELVGAGTITVVPEPTTWGMLLLGGGLLTAVRRFRRRQT